MKQPEPAQVKTCAGFLRLPMHRTSLFSARILHAARLLAVTGALSLFLALQPLPADTSISTAASAPSFPYALVGVSRFDGVSYVNLLDRQTGEHWLLATNQPVKGLVLDSVLTDSATSGPSAIVRYAGEPLLLKLDGSATPASATLPPSVVPPSPYPVNSASNATTNLPIQPPAGASLPLVFAAIDPKKITLTAEQQQELNQLRQGFLNAVGASTSNNATTATATDQANSTASASIAPATTPLAAASLRNWTKAQQQSDDLFRMRFGTQAFLAYQLALAPSSTP